MNHSVTSIWKQITGIIVPLAIGIIILGWFRKRSAEYLEVNPDPSQTGSGCNCYTILLPIF